MYEEKRIPCCSCKRIVETAGYSSIKKKSGSQEQNKKPFKDEYWRKYCGEFSVECVYSDRNRSGYEYKEKS
jgi:hypothetical protein